MYFGPIGDVFDLGIVKMAKKLEVFFGSESLQFH